MPHRLQVPAARSTAAQTSAVIISAGLILLPEGYRIAGFTPADLCLYAAIAYFVAVRTVEFLLAKTRIRFDAVFAGFLILLSFAAVAYGQSLPSFQRQVPFLISIGAYTPHLFAHICVYGVLTLLTFAISYAIGADIGRSSRQSRSMLRAVLVAGSINALVSVVYWFHATGGIFSRYNFDPPIEQSQGAHMDRMVFTFMLAFALWHHRSSRVAPRTAVLGVMTITLVSIATVFVRQGWAVLIASVLLYVALSWSTWPAKWKLRAVVGLLIVACASGYVLTRNRDAVREAFGRLAASDSVDIAVRQTLIVHALDVHRAHPWFGVGYGQYPAYSDVAVSISNEDVYVSSAHNGFVMSWAEFGTVGLSMLIVLAVVLLRNVLQARHTAKGEARAIATVALVLLLGGLVVQFIANNPLMPPPAERVMVHTSVLLWLLLGTASGARAATARHRAIVARRNTADVVFAT